MDSPPPLPPGPPPVPPPPLPPVFPVAKAKNHTLLIVLGIVAVGFALLFVVGLVIIVGAGSARRQAAARKDFEDNRKMATEAQLKIDAANKRGDFRSAMETGDAVIGKMKSQFEDSASSGGRNDGTARAMANFAGKMQTLMRDYATAAEHLQKANVLAARMRDRAEIESDRQIVREFLAANARLLNAGEHREDMMRSELDAEHVGFSSREAALAGFRKAQAESGIYDLGMQIRRCSQKVGENCLAILDLLDQNWGQWSRDDAANVIRFQDTAARESYNALVNNVQTAFQEQRKVQEQVAAKSRAVLAQ